MENMKTATLHLPVKSLLYGDYSSDAIVNVSGYKRAGFCDLIYLLRQCRRLHVHKEPSKFVIDR